MITKRRVSILEAVLLLGFFGGLAGMIEGCVVGFVGGLYELKQANSELKMENSNLKKELEEYDSSWRGGRFGMLADSYGYQCVPGMCLRIVKRWSLQLVSRKRLTPDMALAVLVPEEAAI